MCKYIFCLITLTFLVSFSYAQNHMDIMTSMVGEHSFAGMGLIMTTLDWNGDGNDDLVINEEQWSPEGYPFTNDPYGKLLIYFGSINFDNVPEMEIPGHHEIEFCHTSSMCNAGDMNGDGYDELALFRATMYEDSFDQFYDLQLCVYNGGANPDTIPDYVLTFPREEWDNNGPFTVRCLGDINQDGFSELGYSIGKNYPDLSYTFGIIYGDSLTNTVFLEAGTSWSFADFDGLGDINGDGKDDFCIGYQYEIENIRYSKVILYFGSASEQYSDSLVICEGSNFKQYAYPVGDLNWDGHPEFVSSFTSTGAKLYFGASDFNGSNYLDYAPPLNGGNWNNGFGHGDVNGDGTEDFMGTEVTQFNGYGDAYLWIGGVPMNGTPDLQIVPDFNHDHEMFGFCLTMGDYNVDGYFDAAISAPFNYSGTSFPGIVYVYSGNSQLNDPLPIDDDTATPVVSKLQLYPNPLDPQQSNLNVRFTTPFNPPSGRGVESSTFEIYNIKGQKVKSFVLTAEQTRAGSADFHLNDLSSGVYLCTYANGERILKGKITILP